MPLTTRSVDERDVTHTMTFRSFRALEWTDRQASGWGVSEAWDIDAHNLGEVHDWAQQRLQLGERRIELYALTHSRADGIGEVPLAIYER